MTLAIGDTAPAFTALADNGEKISLSQFKGKNVILYFYPKDDTPGCTTEACDFTQHHNSFEKSNTVIIGVSKDSLQSHQAFKSKYNLPFMLVSDPEGAVCEKYAAWGEKKNYGKTYEGIIRSTFLIDEKGKIKAAMYNVKATRHVEKILREFF
jgi:peroxiredoxin Q/BCP